MEFICTRSTAGLLSFLHSHLYLPFLFVLRNHGEMERLFVIVHCYAIIYYSKQAYVKKPTGIIKILDKGPKQISFGPSMVLEPGFG